MILETATTPRVIGLTGNIACGKSAVAALLRAQGFTVVDADAVARDILSPGQPAYEDIVAAFGHSVLNDDGSINRKNLRSLVFKNSTYLKTLEIITHPAIIKASKLEFERLFHQGKSLIFYEASLLVETNRHKDLNGLIVVTCPPSLQLARLIARDAINETLALQMIAAQMPQEQKASYATWIIENTGDLQKLESDLKSILLELGSHS